MDDASTIDALIGRLESHALRIGAGINDDCTEAAKALRKLKAHRNGIVEECALIAERARLDVSSFVETKREIADAIRKIKV